MNKNPLRTSKLAKISIATGAFFALSWSAQAATLAELVTQAQTYDAAYAAAKQQLIINEAQADAARASLLPSVGLSVSASNTRVESFGTSNSQSLGVIATQSLFNRSASKAAQRASLGNEVAEAQLAAAEQELTIRVAEGYFGLLTAQAQVASVRAAKEAVAAQLERAKRNFEVGTSTITDTREAQAQFDRIAAEEIAALNQVKVQQLAMEQLVGRPGVSADDIDAERALPPLSPANVTAWIAQALQNNPQVKLAKIAKASAELAVDQAQAGHMPLVTASYAYSKPYTDSGCVSPSSGCAINQLKLSLEMPIFAGYAVQNQVKSAVATASQSADQLDQAKRTVAQGVRAAYYGIESGRAQIQALQAAVASSQSALEANQTGYAVGVRINADVLAAQSQLYQTRFGLTKARYDVLLGQLKLHQAAGTLSSAQLEALSALTK